MSFDVTNDINRVINNDDNLYEGTLWYYYNLAFNDPSAQNPYHNLRHFLHVLWLCFLACGYYGAQVSKRDVRNLLIAALMHDIRHSGHNREPDSENIKRAVAFLRKVILPEDADELETIITIIEATESPHRTDLGTRTLLQQIIQDADLCQALDTAWIQQICIGLATEQGVAPIEMLALQPSFIAGLSFNTQWAEELFSPQLREQKIKEAHDMLQGLLTQQHTK